MNRVSVLAAALLAVAGTCAAKGPQQPALGVTSDPAAIAAVMRTIPMTDKDMGYANLGERLAKLGIQITRMDAGRWSDGDLALNPAYRRTDVEYQFDTTKANAVVLSLCPISERFGLIRRGKTWIPEDRTANWLMNGYGHCRAPR